MGMYEHFRNFPWVLPVVPYDTTSDLLATFAERVNRAGRTVVKSKGCG